MGDVHFEVLIRVCVSGIAVQCEGFPLAGKGVVVMTSMKGWRRLDWCGGKGCAGMGCRMMVGNVVV